MTLEKNFKLDYKIKKPKNFDKYKIGIIGAGNIVETSHLPIYIKENLNISNIFDISTEKAENLKKKFKIEKFSKSLDEFFKDGNFDIVDIAVPSVFNQKLFSIALNNHKNILIQKPLSNNINTAKKIIKEYKKFNYKANVNHQMRYSPSIRAAKDILNKNYLGKITRFNFFTHRKTDWSIWPWLNKIDYPELRYNSIHYLDSIRYLFGEPKSLKASLLYSTNEILNKPTNISVNLKFNNHIVGDLNITHDSELTSNNWKAGYEIIGENGICKGVISSMIGNGLDFKDKISISYKKNNKNINIDKILSGRWFSESFSGPVFSLINAIQNNQEAETNIFDAFKTLQLVELVIKSHEAKKWVKL